MRFLADENISHLVINRLRVAGFDVASIRETRPATPDKDILEIAVAEDRILITQDRDFGELIIRQRLSVRGIVLLELDRLASASVSAHVEKLVGNLVVIEPGRIRFRPLPE
jgi:predicted nuclease of predicted toxin-antitoxin system